MDYYRILEITEQADEEQIKQAYRRLAKKYHPDLNQGNPEAEEKFKNIAKAYEVLGDATMRKAYDSKRRTPVIYGNPCRNKPECSKSGHNKTGHNGTKFNRTDTASNESVQTEHRKTRFTKTEATLNEPVKAGLGKAKYSQAGHDEAKHSKQHGEYQDSPVDVKENKTDFTVDLERYFGFAFEEGKKVVKEQGSQVEQEDSPELAEIFKMFMKMK